MDGNPQPSVLKHYEVKNVHGKDPVLSLNGDVALASGYVMNGYSGKPADNDGSGSESGYTTPKKRRARRSSVKGTENTIREKEKAAKPYSKQDTETSSQETSGKAPHSRPNSTRTCVKPEVYAGARRTGDTSPVAEVPHRNIVSLVGKKTDDRLNKAKLVSSVSSKEDSWTLFKPPPVFPVDNSSAKIVPKISYASKVKENLTKATQASAETPQTSAKLLHVPMSAVKTLASASFAASVDANGCLSVGTAFSSLVGVCPAPSASSKQGEEDDAESGPDNGRSSPSRSAASAPEPRKSSLFVYPHKPLNMQPPAAQTNQKALGDIFQNQWGLSFINEPNAGPVGAPVSRPAVPFEISALTFQGGNVPFLIRPSPNAVSLLPPQDVQRRTNGTGAAVKAYPASRTAGQDCPRARQEEQECRSSDAPRELLEGLSKAHTVQEQEGACGWGWADLQAAVFYHTKGRVSPASLLQRRNTVWVESHEFEF